MEEIAIEPQVMEVFVARHPIFDNEKKVYGYELEFRPDFYEHYDSMKPDQAKLDFMTLLNFDELGGHAKGFMPVTRNLLLKELATMLPREAVTVVLPAAMEIDDEVLAACRRLHEAGYEVMMDSVMLQRGGGEFLEFADIVRIDAVGPSSTQQAKTCKDLSEVGIRVTAGKIDSADEFEGALACGYTYFQGDFFAKPVIRPGQQISSSRLGYMRLLQEVNRPEIAYDELETLIKQDVSMTYKLLRFMNSAWYGLRYEVKSIRHALVLLGPDEVKTWASMLALRNVGDDKPMELLCRSLTRAKVAEQVAPMVGMQDQASELFLMGMLSLIDALTDMPLEKTIKDLPLSDPITDALLTGSGSFRPIYDMILAYEKGDWDLLATSAGSVGLDEQKIPELFRESVKWSHGVLEAM